MTAADETCTREPAAIEALLERWLPHQRWFAGKGRDFEVSAVEVAGTLTTEPARSELTLVTIRYTDGGADVYTVPLLYLPDADEHLEHARVGLATDGDSGEARYVYDALHAKDVTGAWLRGVAGAAPGGTDGATSDGDTSDAEVPSGTDDSPAATGDSAAVVGELHEVEFHATPGAAELDVEAPSLVSTAEQSNTSLIFGDAAILKVFRRVEHGRNPDIEVHEVLADLGSRHVASLLGWASTRWTAPDGTVGSGDVAMLQEFLRSATDGWALAQISVRDLFAEADLHADEVGGDFAGEAYRLGTATAETHLDLARLLPTGSYGPAELGRLAEGMRRRLTAAVAIAPALGPYETTLAEVYDRLAQLDRPVPTQRVHGDLHLGQVMRTSQRWVMLDFEGEPAKPVAERELLDSPVRDVAGMLRSFDYASRHQLVDHPADAQIAYRADEWSTRNREAFCAGYVAGGGPDPTEPSALLVAYEADKAVYEVAYEARNRPSWLPIPLAAVARLAQAADPTADPTV